MMQRPVARLGDLHVCAMAPVPGLPIAPPCALPVLFGFMPAARVTDVCVCGGPPPANADPIITGSTTVFVDGLPLARIGDFTAKGGVITTGLPNVQIG